ncbi:hypothetical protein ATK74_2760 [Propionicimonas paludicola]|uniref:Carboxypeptidase family protein n=1 Tax=Propionicimonas paludicola TaxID=185243 RepID=A0A2A9CUV1_9ACTN|nr:hypothetical protein [Propionicimonas paludicola]PFG18178.1 hypothetical protein ATK74_2760 [Propionicimonas paludicola]
MNRARHGRLFLLPVAVAAVFALLAGCTAASNEPVSTPTPTPAPGLLVGHLYVKGGLDPKTYTYAAKLTATAIYTSTPAVYNFEAGKDGAFRIELPPGIYMVTSVPIGNESGGQVDPHEVTIRSGGTYTLETTSIHP